MRGTMQRPSEAEYEDDERAAIQADHAMAVPQPMPVAAPQRPAPVALRPEAPPAPAQPGPRSSDRTEQLFAALAAAQSEFGEVVKTRTASIRANFSYKYANLADVNAAVAPALRKHGLVPMQIPMGSRVYVRLVHGPSGEWIEGGLPLALPDHGQDIQRLGSALTYMRRYLLTMMLGIVADDEDDDGIAAMPQRGAR